MTLLDWTGFDSGGLSSGARVALLGFFGFSLTLILWVSTTEFWFVPTAVLLSFAYVYWSFSRPVVAIITIIILYFSVVEGSEEITLPEVAFAAYFFGYLGFWFVKRIFFQRVSVITSAADKFLVSFFFVGCSSVVIIVSNGGSILSWLREFITLSYLMLIFPARDALKSEIDFKLVTSGFVVLVFAVAVRNLVEYATASATAVYLWELISNRRPFGAHFFFPVVVVGMSLFVHGADRRRFLFLTLSLASGVALALTFTRGFWLAAAVGLIVLFFLVDWRAKIRMVITWLIMGTIAIGSLYLFAGRAVEFIVDALVVRVGTFGNTLQDLSVAERIAESKTVIGLIAENPLLGYGMGATFKHYNILDRFTDDQLYIHNGYLYLLFKVGLLGTLFFLGFYISVLFRGFKLSRSGMLSPFVLAVSRGCTCILVAMLFVTITSNVFRDKESLLVVALASAVIMALKEGDHAEAQHARSLIKR